MYEALDVRAHKRFWTLFFIKKYRPNGCSLYKTQPKVYILFYYIIVRVNAQIVQFFAVFDICMY